MAEVCELVNADVVTLARALGYDDRIGSRFLNAGLGFGGGCLPKDIRAFSARAGELGASDSLRFLHEVDKINVRRREKTVSVASALVGGEFLSKNIAVLGAAFKANSDDVRDSPALNVAASMHLRGADVRVHDPKAIANARARFLARNSPLPATANPSWIAVKHLLPPYETPSLDRVCAMQSLGVPASVHIRAIWRRGTAKGAWMRATVPPANRRHCSFRSFLPMLGSWRGYLANRPLFSC